MGQGPLARSLAPSFAFSLHFMKNIILHYMKTLFRAQPLRRAAQMHCTSTIALDGYSCPSRVVKMFF